MLDAANLSFSALTGRRPPSLQEPGRRQGQNTIAGGGEGGASRSVTTQRRMAQLVCTDPGDAGRQDLRIERQHRRVAGDITVILYWIQDP